MVNAVGDGEAPDLYAAIFMYFAEKDL